jgi:hypothetical protein
LPVEVSAQAAAVIKRADRIAAFHEAVELAGFGREEALKYFGAPEPLPRAVLALLAPWPTHQAQAHFLGRFGECGG